MAFDVGTTNAAQRYYLISDDSSLTLPDSDWFVAAVVKQSISDNTFAKYFISSGTVGNVNTFNMLIQASSGRLNVRYNNATAQSPLGEITPNVPFLVFAYRSSNTVYGGYSQIGTGDITQSDGVAASGTSSNGGNWYIGARNDLDVDRAFRGYVEWMALSNSATLTTEEAQRISRGESVLSVLGKKLTYLWHWQQATSIERDIIAGSVATRNGTGWADAEDSTAIYVYDPFTYPENPPVPILIDGAPGSISVSGVSSNVSIDIVINGIAGGISLSAETNEIIQANHVNAAPGEITLSALQGNVIQSHHVNASPDQISLTGEQSHISLAMIIDAVSAGISIDALQAVLPVGVLVSSVPDGISITGLQAGISLGTTIDANPASISVDGISSSVSNGIYIDSSPDDVSLSSIAANVGISMLIDASTAEISILDEQSEVSLINDPIVINAITGTISISTVTGQIVYGSIVLVPEDRIIGFGKDLRTIGFSKDDRVIGINNWGGYVN